MSLDVEAKRAWIVPGAAFWVTGTVVVLVSAAATGDLFETPLEMLAVAGGLGLVVVGSVLPARLAVLRNGRAGPAWGAVAAASGGLVLAALLAALAVLTSRFPRSVVNVAAASLLIVLPMTVALAVAGALLESDRLERRLAGIAGDATGEPREQ